MRLLGAVPIDLPLGEARDDLVEGHAALEPCERGPEAEVDPVAEGQVVVDDAGDVEAVGVWEVTLVAVPASTFCPWCSTSWEM